MRDALYLALIGHILTRGKALGYIFFEAEGECDAVAIESNEDSLLLVCPTSKCFGSSAGRPRLCLLPNWVRGDN